MPPGVRKELAWDVNHCPAIIAQRRWLYTPTVGCNSLPALDPLNQDHIVLTLDAGGTSLRFCAMRGGRPITETIVLPTQGENLGLCLANIVSGFVRVRGLCPAQPAAISFAFPGPADFPNGIIGDLGNLPGFRGGVALGPMLEDKFGIPVFINNDGDLFTLGESIAGLLPQTNALLEKAGSPKRFQNLLGVTLGTGFGGGIVRGGELFLGDNSLAGEVWLLRNKLHPKTNAEESISIRAVRRVYAERAGIPFASAPEPKDIFEIGMGRASGNRQAAVEAFRCLGEATGDAVAQAATLVDGLVVIGGGLANAWPLFLPALMSELNANFRDFGGQEYRRLTAMAYNLEEPAEREAFLRGEAKEIVVPQSPRKVMYDPQPRIGVGMSRLGTSEAVATGAYAFALQKLK